MRVKHAVCSKRATISRAVSRIASTIRLACRWYCAAACSSPRSWACWTCASSPACVSEIDLDTDQVKSQARTLFLTLARSPRSIVSRRSAVMNGPLAAISASIAALMRSASSSCLPAFPV